MPYIGLKAGSVTVGDAPLVVLDTNAVLNIADSHRAQVQFIEEFRGHVAVLPAIVHVELAGKTHPESYRTRDSNARRTMEAARASAVLMVPGGRWPSATAPSVAFGYPTRAYWARLSRQRLRGVEEESGRWLTWSHDERGRLHSAPAMTDHQVLLTAWGLQEDEHPVTLLTDDAALRAAATRFGVATRMVASSRAGRA